MQIFDCLGGFLSLLASLYVRVTAPHRPDSESDSKRSTNLVPRSYRETKIYTIFKPGRPGYEF